jgi:hypothetical protein
MHPYEKLPERHFWSSAVAKRNMFDIEQLWEPRFPIEPTHQVATFGSCFAQHFGRALSARGFNWLIAEQPPRGLDEDHAKEFNYGVFSARTGNIYTASLLKQWVEWATGTPPPQEVWEQDGRFYDPFRPNIEPNGFASREEVTASREMAIEAFRTCLTGSNVFVFTLGLTESWFHAGKGYEYPMCPGTVAGTFDAKLHKFVNQDYAFISTTLLDALRKARGLNPKLKFLLTVSPVPLSATASGNHVLVATMESKSILRAVAGHVSRQLEEVDYFPSYEIINAPPFRGAFFEPNQRSVNHAGVDHVMSSFFAGLHAKYPIAKPEAAAETRAQAQVEGAAAPASARRAASAAVREARRRQRVLRRQGQGQGQGPSPGAGAAGAAGTAAAGANRRAGGGRKRAADVVCEEELLNAFAKDKAGK